MMRRIVRRLHGEEKGSAMTEFVLTLPIFIMIFAGMGMLYRYNQEALIARMKTNKKLWADATAPNTIPGFVPGAGGVVSIMSFGDIALNGSGALGMYVDSYIKAGLAEALIPGQAIKNPASPPKATIQQITGMSGTSATASFTNTLLNDLAVPQWDSSGWANILSSVVATVAVAPSLVAGIRYVPVMAEETHNFYHPWTGNESYNPGRLQLAAPTAAHHRIGAVAASRIAMNTVQPYKTSILEFNMDMDTSGNPGANTSSVNSVNQQANECEQQSNQWQACLNDPTVQALPTQEDRLDACEDLEPSGDCRNLGSNMAQNFNQNCHTWCQRP